MSFWLYILLGLAIGVVPSLIAAAPFRSWWARRWWKLAIALAVTLLLLPFGIVLILFLIDSAWEAIGELWLLWTGEFRGLAGLALGWLTGSSAMAWCHRHAPYLQGPPLSEQAKALARDPDKHPQAVQRYQQETGAALPVAMDVVEQYGMTAEGAQRRPPGAIEWMYGGFAAAWYAILTLAFVLTYSGNANPILAAFGFFFCVPALFSGFCGICAGALSVRTKAAFHEGWQRRTLTRRYAFFSGAVAGVLSIAGVLGGIWVLYPLAHSEVVLWAGFIWVGAVLIGAPFFAVWLLRNRLRDEEGRHSGLTISPR